MSSFHDTCQIANSSNIFYLKHKRHARVPRLLQK